MLSNVINGTHTHIYKYACGNLVMLVEVAESSKQGGYYQICGGKEEQFSCSLIQIPKHRRDDRKWEAAVNRYRHRQEGTRWMQFVAAAAAQKRLMQAAANLAICGVWRSHSFYYRMESAGGCCKNKLYTTTYGVAAAGTRGENISPYNTRVPCVLCLF